MLDTRGGVGSPPKRKVLSKNIFKGEADRRFNRIAHMEQKTLNTFRDKAGSDIAYKDLASKVDKAYEHAFAGIENFEKLLLGDLPSIKPLKWN